MRIDARRPVGDELDVVLGIEAVGMDVRHVEPGLAAQHGLGEGRALVRHGRFLADEDDPPLEARFSGPLRSLRAGHAGTHHDECG